MKQLLVAFGDSWTFGSELHTPASSSWPCIVSNKLNAELLNYGTPASSIGHLVVQLFNFIDTIYKFKDYKIIFMVGLSGQSRYLSYYENLDEFVNISTEAVYRTRDILPTGQPPGNVEELLPYKAIHYRYVDSKKYTNFLTAQTLFAFQNYTRLNNIDSIYFSYFDQLDLSKYERLLETKSIYQNTITKAITGQEYDLPQIRDHCCFQGKLFHPNEFGHQAIANILLDFYETNKSC